MSNDELTPERIRDAAETLKQIGPVYGLVVRELGDHADRLEREQAAEAKREKRVEELAEELHRAYWEAPDPLTPTRGFSRVAQHLLDRYPALLEESDE